MKRRKRRGARAALIGLSVFLGLVLAVMAGVAIYATRLMNLVNRVGDEPLQTLSQEQLDELLSDEVLPPEEQGGAVVLQPEQVQWGEQTQHNISVSDDVRNFLLIGQDARGDYRARSDTMILVTVNKRTHTITLTSILRDLYVQIPGYQDNKINAAYPAGGMELLNEVLEVNFGIPVDANVEVDFGRFAQVINTVGGVDLELREDEAAHINKEVGYGGLGAGVMHLDGNQALSYSRIRYLDRDADFSRTNRQRKVINAIIEKFRSAKLTELVEMVEQLLPMVTTDMTNGEMLAYATELFPVLEDCTIVSQRIPEDGAYELAMIRGMSCVVADMDAARALVERTLAGE